MEKKTVRLDIKQIEQNDDVYTFEGHLAVFNNVDFGGDRINPDAFDEWMKIVKANGETSIPVFWVHRSSEPVGIMPIKDMQIDKKGLFVKGLLPKEDTFVAGRVIPQMKIGSVAKMSIGYDTIECTEEKTEDGGWVRILEKLHLYEGSLVPVAMNDEARITAMKAESTFVDDVTSVDERNLETMLRKGARFSNKMAKAIVSAIKSAGLRDGAADLRDGDNTADTHEVIAALDLILKQIGGK